MSHACGDEAHDHHGHDHGHDHDGPDRGFEFTLYTQIDLNRVRCLNETVNNSAVKIFKTHENRFEDSLFVESDADEQLILYIPFTSSVKIKSISVLGFNDSSAPSKMKAYTNREDIDFDSVDSTECVQEWELVESVPPGQLPEYPTRMARFSNLRNLTLFFPSNFGNEKTRITYIGLKGEWTQINKDPIIAIYEAAPNPSDHKKILSAMEKEYQSPSY